VTRRRDRPVRTACDDDAATIAGIYIDAWRTAYAGLLPDRVLLDMSHSRQRIGWSRQIGGGDTVLVALDGRRDVVGVASGGRCRDRRFPGAGEVFTLYVSPAHQGQGHGKALLDAILNALGQSGSTSALLWVLARNPSRFFYEAMGGIRIAERDEAIWGVVLPEIAYRWALPPSSGGLSGKHFISPLNNDEDA